jgi:hypothetical protein
MRPRAAPRLVFDGIELIDSIIIFENSTTSQYFANVLQYLSRAPHGDSGFAPFPGCDGHKHLPGIMSEAARSGLPRYAAKYSSGIILSSPAWSRKDK